jgi:formylmethanofuran dehydrogenase subunit C
MPLNFESQLTTTLPVEAAELRPDRFVGAPLNAIRRFKLSLGNQPTEVGELFKLSGENTGAWRFTGPMSHVHGLGSELAAGEIEVEGPIGNRCGWRMRGGALRVRGDAGDWLGAELRGGVVEVTGSAGDGAGAALPGAPRGMRGGVLLIHGSAGQQTAAAMRRGLVAIGRACGELAAYRMLAGSLMVFGACGPNPGVEMRRGTLALLGESQPVLPPTFKPACRMTPPALPLLLLELNRHKFPVASLPREIAIHNAERAEAWTTSVSPAAETPAPSAPCKSAAGG